LSFDYNKQEAELRAVERAMIWGKSLLVVIAFVVPICAAILWWFIGDKIEQVRDQFLDPKGVSEGTSKASLPTINPAPNGKKP
jgi:hypothetical protein